MIKIAICDDNKEELARSRSYCIAFVSQYPEHEVALTTFEDPKLLLSHIERKGSFDLIILDIYMPEVTGVQLARILRNNEDMCEIIFLTTSEHHAVEAFALHATHYIVKPYTPEQFNSALEKAFSQLEKLKTAKLTVKSAGSMHTILFENLLYAETEKHLQHIHLADGKSVRTRMTSLQLFDRLSQDGRFYKYGSSYILNLGKIREINARSILFDTNTQLPMQRRQYKALIDRYTQYSLKGQR